MGQEQRWFDWLALTKSGHRGGRVLAAVLRRPWSTPGSSTSRSTCTRCTSSGRPSRRCTARAGSCSSISPAPRPASATSYVFSNAEVVGRRQRRRVRPVRGAARRGPGPQAGAHPAGTRPDDADRRAHRGQPASSGSRVTYIDNAAHIGGLLAGCWLGLTMVPRGRRDARLVLVDRRRSPVARPRSGVARRCRRGPPGSWAWARWPLAHLRRARDRSAAMGSVSRS